MATGRDPSNEKLEAFLRTLLGANHALGWLGRGGEGDAPAFKTGPVRSLFLRGRGRAGSVAAERAVDDEIQFRALNEDDFLFVLEEVEQQGRARAYGRPAQHI